VTVDRFAPRLAAARLVGVRPRWAGLLLALAMVWPEAGAHAQEQPAPIAPAKDWSKVPLESRPGSPPPVPDGLRVHQGWYFGTGLALGDATAGGAGKAYSLEALNGGRSVIPWGLDVRGGYTLRPDLRLGVAVSTLMAQVNQTGFGSAASVARVGGELSWHPRGDGPFVRGELGIGLLQLTGDLSASAGSGRDISRSGPAVTLGGGWLFSWHHLGIAHLAIAADLSWATYGGTTGPGDQLDWSLAWALKVGVDVW